MPSGDGTAPGDELVFPAGACFGCSPTNASGLRLRFYRAGDGVVCPTTVPSTYQGAPEVVHGGIQAVLLDETCCAAAFFTTGRYVVTGELALRYQRPCPVGRPLVVRARIAGDAGRYLVIRGEICEAEGTEVLTTAEGKFFPQGPRGGP